MYNKAEGGTLEIIQDIECWIPPVGFGVDRVTGEMVKIGVYTASAKKSEQKWERVKLPADYDKKRAKEEIKQREAEGFKRLFALLPPEKIGRAHV